MILTALLLLATQGPPTLAATQQGAPEAAGDLVLAGHDHGPIARIVIPVNQGMNPPGLIERQLVETPVAGAEGCSRKRWNVTFFHGPAVTRDEAPFQNAYATTEVALSGAAGCPNDGYTRLNTDVQPAQGFAALRYLDDLRLRGAKARFTCSDKTSSHLCAGPAKIRQALAMLTPWAVTLEDGDTLLWLGEPGQVVTEVRYRLDRPGRVAVRREIPAPF
jgi:hypothetical protein